MTDGIGRPREDHVPTKEAHCKTHGIVIKRGYPMNRTLADGSPVEYIKWSCPDCVRDYQAHRRAVAKAA